MTQRSQDDQMLAKATLPGEYFNARIQSILTLLDKQHVVRELEHRHVPEHRQVLMEGLLHRQQEQQLKQKLVHLRPAEIADLLEMLPSEQRGQVWQELGDNSAWQVLEELSDSLSRSLIEQTEQQRLNRILAAADLDGLAEMADLVPAEILKQIKAKLEAADRLWLETSLSFPEDTVGDLMSRDMVLIRESYTLRQTIEHVRSQPSLPAQTDKLFVTNGHHELLGTLALTTLLQHDEETRVSSVMEHQIVTFTPEENAEQAGLAFERYDLISAPVIDHKHRLIGRLTVETVMDYLREQAEEDALNREGLSGDTDLFGPPLSGAIQRWPWLAANLCTAFIASRFIDVFEGTILQLVALASLMPIVASIGGNTGNQTIALIVRGLALGQLRHENLRFVVLKEILISVVNGLLWGSVLGALAAWLYHNVLLGLVLTTATVLNLLLAALVGIGVPLLLRRCGRDPAMGASVVLTFVTDSMGFLIFLGLAQLVLVH